MIAKIENLDNLSELSILNLSFNRIEKVEGLGSLTKLNTFNITHNLLGSIESLAGLIECPSIANLDLSHNEIDSGEDLLSLFKGVTELTCLYLRNTPIPRTFKSYRKKFVSSLPKLKFLDDRPVFENERRLAEAWAKGGQELETIEKGKLFEEREAANRKTYDDFEKL